MGKYTLQHAVISQCTTFRYCLERAWANGSDRMLIIGLNPSTANAEIDDRTVGRCVAFAQREGLSGILLANLFAFRSLDPTLLRQAIDPIGPENDSWIARLRERATVIVGAWGNGGIFLDRAQNVRRLLSSVMCFGVTLEGEPRHPLYVHGSTPLTPLF
jgi:hypothetical protein